MIFAQHETFAFRKIENEGAHLEDGGLGWDLVSNWDEDW